MSFNRGRWIVLIMLTCLIASMAFGQIRSGTITGTVQDTTGAVVPGIEVVLTNQETNISDTTTTTATGQYTFTYLPASTFTVAISTEGFAPYRQTNIALANAQTVRIDVGLQVGTVAEAIEVVADAAQLQTESSTVSGAVESRMIDILPNPTSNPMYYAFLQAGVVPRSGGSNTTNADSFGIGVAGRTQWSAMGINGGRASTNEFQLDGLPVMGGGYNEVAVTPNTEGLAEVRVIANNFSAQYGHGQGVISMSTKSGTNEYHGEGNYTIRNEALMANTLANKNDGVSRPPFKVHEFGGSVGGPILKDKLFFFTSYHYLRFNNGQSGVMRTMTPLEKIGDFSQTMIPDESGQPVLAQIYDPFNVTQLGPDLYERALIPGGDLSGRASAQYAQLWASYYPDPNLTPVDQYQTNNFGATAVQTLRRHNLNNRIDYRMGKHSIYGSGGITKSSNVTPRYFGAEPLNDAPRDVGDNNPFAQIGDTIVVSPTLILDMRYGIARIVTNSYGGNKTGWDDSLYDQFGVPKNIRPLFATNGAAPILNFQTCYGGTNCLPRLTDGLFANKHEGQSMHTGAFSITKINGNWTHKFGFEARNLLSNYTDFEEATAQYRGFWFDQGGNFNFQYVDANGGSVGSQNTTNVQNGLDFARAYLGAPGWWIRPGTNVAPAFAQKYGAIYTQNDWRATSKLTINLGLRWDLQPGPTDRYDRMSGVDLTANNPFGTKGLIAMPGLGSYSRNLWDTRYSDFGPRVGAAYQLTNSLVLRGGFGITYLPSNSGFWSSPVDYGASTFSSGTFQKPYGDNPNGVPAIDIDDPAYLSIATGNDMAAPTLYGVTESKFSRDYKNGRATQFNFFIEKSFARGWFASVGYSGSRSDDLMYRNFPVNSMQAIPSSLREQWAADYVASNLTSNPANQQITNPYQPTDSDLLSFSGPLGAATIARYYTYYTYPHLAGLQYNLSGGWSRYHSGQVRVTHAYSSGFYVNMTYTFAKGINNTAPTVDQGKPPDGEDYYNWNNNLHLDSYDIKHRVVATFLYDLPFGQGRMVNFNSRLADAILGGWQVGGTVTAQTGMPFFLQGASNGALIARPDRISDVVEVPENLQRWYDGQTDVTLPNGRVIRPGKNTFLKYYSGAFSGRVVQLPNGKLGAAQNWVGTSARVYDDMRGPGRFNLDLSVRKSVKITERVSLELSAESSNFLNGAQFSGTYDGNLGNTLVGADTAGWGSSSSFGTVNDNTFPAREVVLKARVRF